MLKCIQRLLWVLCVVAPCSEVFSQFTISSQTKIQAVADKQQYATLMKQFLEEDIQKVYGKNISSNTASIILLRVAGTSTPQIPSAKIQAIDKSLQGKWEVFSFKTIQHNQQQYLIVTGSDRRGLAYGTFTLSEKLGVSPWYFLADIPVASRTQATIIQDSTSAEPSVQYRGIFINDEDWGLQPWAAKTFEPETKDIGPKTYAKVFELLLRLKANMIWPAMHPSTKAFYHYPQNKEVANQYGIVVGTSHAEPMMRNNVDEWVDSTMGEYNYRTNKNRVTDYWIKRLEEVQNYENLYTIGMRGKHDSGMEGIKTKKEAVALTNLIINEQRALLSKYLKKKVQDIPQVLTLYKEVLELYKEGLEVPEDITLIWPDDNYGYIKNLSNANEQKRSGGSGVYYHASYWGRPHDYLWIGTTDPSLLRFEMQKAYELGSRKIWVLNVGDIKPQEYPTQLFLDMAYNMQPFLKNISGKEHLENWTFKNLGSKEYGSLLWKNYQLAFIRKPEFMGWSRTEPTTQTKATDFSLEEVKKRITDFESLERGVAQLEPQSELLKSPYFQLVAYPILGASKMNQKFLYLDLYYRTAPNARTDQQPEFQKSLEAYQGIQSLTKQYNSGKWQNMMSMNPRNLPVFKKPEELKNVPQKIDKVSASIKIMIPAGAFSEQGKGTDSYWEKIAEPSFTGNALVSKPFSLQKSIAQNSDAQAWVNYEVDIEKEGNYVLKLKAIPLHPLHRNVGQKVEVKLDKEIGKVIDYETFDRSEEWKENVLTNKTIKEVTKAFLTKGKHIIQLRMIDAGVLLDSIQLEGLE